MKFLTLTAFEKHLQEAFPDHLSPIFLIAMPSDQERRVIIQQLSDLLHKKSPAARRVKFCGEEFSYEGLSRELQTPTLWGGMPIVICDFFEKIYPEGGDLPFVPQGAHLILGTPLFKEVMQFYHLGKKEVIALDLSQEKFFEKEKRAIEWVMREVEKNKKKINRESLFLLVRRWGADLSLIDQELAKLLCYLGEKEEIKAEDIDAIGSFPSLSLGWGLAERLVWEGPISLERNFLNNPLIFSWIGQIRYHLQMGYRISELIEMEKNFLPLVRSYFPQFRSQQLERWIQIAQKRKKLFYRKGLQALYEWEYLSKISPLKTTLLFDLFQAKMYSVAYS